MKCNGLPNGVEHLLHDDLKQTKTIAGCTSSPEITVSHQISNNHVLRVLVVGAGIGGLTAALALRHQGHEVEVFESSGFNKELGAALHLAPNGNGVLKRLGLSAIDTGANKCSWITEYSADGTKIREKDLAPGMDIWQHEWLLAHRVKLHDALKTAAIAEVGQGQPVKLHTSHSVVDVDVKNAIVHFSDGSDAKGDVVLGADGVHSITRAKVPGANKKPHGCGKSAFRFMVAREHIVANPATKKFADKDSEMIGIFGSDRRIVIYPTSDNKTFNFVCIHPQAESKASDGWGNSATRNVLLDVYRGFSSDIRELLKMANEESLKVWKLLDMDVIPEWTNDRLALLGDAAHPFLPYQGQGASCAIEDAVSLGVVLERGLPSDEVSGRLKLYQRIRKGRADKLQELSRGRDEHVSKKRKTFDVSMNYNFDHDEYDNSMQRLREWKWRQASPKYWRMPTVFGPMPGLRQTHAGSVRDGTNSTYTNASIKIKTSKTVLQNLLPPGKSWRFTSPGTFAYCTFTTTTLNNIEWLGGDGYNHLGLYIHGVECDEDGEKVKGSFLPILFENLADPIVSGREELGMPKVYSDLDIDRDRSSYRIRASWNGLPWGMLQLNSLQEVDLSTTATNGTKPSQASSPGSSTDNDEGILFHRYISQVGQKNKGRPDSDHSVFIRFAEDVPKPIPTRAWTASQASIKFNPGDWKSLPTLHHIISRLAEIPIYEIVRAKIVEGRGVSDARQARRVGLN